MKERRKPGFAAFVVSEIVAWALFLIAREAIGFGSQGVELLAALVAATAGILGVLVLYRLL